MSLDGRYLLAYDSLPYKKPTPMSLDKKFILEKYEDCLIQDLCYGNTILFEPAKYTLDRDDIEKLHADQIFERLDCQLWEQIK